MHSKISFEDRKNYRTMIYEALFVLTGIASLYIVMPNFQLTRNVCILGNDASLNDTLLVVSLPHHSMSIPIKLVEFDE